jgi:small-conductance mechanosensitive channel
MNHLRLVLSFLPHWLTGAAIMLAPAILARLMYRWFMDRLARLAGRYGPFWHTLILRGEGPLSAILVVFVLGALLPAASFPAPANAALAHLLVIALVLAVGWAAMRAVDLAAEFYLQRVSAGVAEDLRARKLLTQVHILRRTAQTVLAILTVAAALMTLPAVQQYGVSLFASAGAAGIVLGLAARPVLSNLIAGIQIAMTQPIRVEDAVVVEGEFGWIENITSTYVVVRVWDLRRLIVPLSYFIEKPFENWTYDAPQLRGTVLLHVDYTVPVDRVRQKFEEILRASPLWDGKASALQVVDALPGTMQLRALVSARNAGELWDLRCAVREQLLAFVQQEYPEALPRQRQEIVGPAEQDHAAALPKAAAHRK